METDDNQECPVCNRFFPQFEIEKHVNKCLFLNTSETPKRKRSPSPNLMNNSSSEDPTSPIINVNNNKKISTGKKNRNFKITPDKNINKNISCSSSSDKSSENLSTFIDLLSESVSPEKCDKRMHPFFNKKLENKSKLEKKSNTSKKLDLNDTKHDSASSSKKQENLSFIVPLAKQLQPKDLDDFVGQNHVLGENSVLRTLLAKGEVPNMILWGPPGCGKTSLAGVIQELCKKESKRLRFVTLCAANSGVKDVQTIIIAAKNELKFGRQTVLFMDEIHRFNKRQQDVFLLHVEKGEIILIGATTENPSFSINSALLSRCRVIVFEKLETEALVSILVKAVNNLGIELIEDDNPHTYDSDKTVTKLSIEKSALTWLADISDGDARIALTNLQLVLQHNTDNVCILTIADIEDGIKKSHLLYDKKGEEYYNLISALHKSIRHGDPNASLYWLARMTVSGEDPLYIARRMVRAASEDIGNADPNALQLAVSTMQGCQLLGMPECDVLLAQCAIYLARAPKSREADTALGEAKHFIKNHEGPQPGVPMHLRNAPTKLMKELGYGKLANNAEYTCMPSGFEDVSFL